MSSRAAAAGRGGDSSCAPVHSHSHICPAPPAPGPLSPSLRILRWRRQHPWSTGVGASSLLWASTVPPTDLPARLLSSCLSSSPLRRPAQIERNITVTSYLDIHTSIRMCRIRVCSAHRRGGHRRATRRGPCCHSLARGAREARGGAQGSRARMHSSSSSAECAS